MKVGALMGWVLALSISAAGHAQTLTKPEEVGMSGKQLALLHDALKLHIDAGQIPGGIVLVARDGKVVHFEAQGTSAAGTPLQTDSVFGIASLSKPVTAVAVLMLVESGKIQLDDPVSKYLPEFGKGQQVRVLKPGSPPPAFSPLPGVLPTQSEFGAAQYELVAAERPITIRMLLTHTSGIQIFGVPNDFPQPKPGEKLADIVPRLALQPLEFQPGSRWAYSNGAGFEILGRVVEVVSGQPFNQYLKQRLFEPLGMKDTDFGVHPDAVARAMAMVAGAKPPLAENTTYFNGAAGLWSTIGDYAHFVQMLLDGGRAGGRQFLKADTIKAMASNQIGPLLMGGYPPMALPPEGVKFGYGVLNVTNPTASGTQVPIGSFGWDGVGTRRWWAIPEQHIAIVMMAPPIGPAAAPLQRDVESIVMRSILPKP